MPPFPIAALLAAAAVAAVTWAVVLGRIARSVRRMGWVEDGLISGREAAPAAASVAIVIPAHNEARVIDACARGVRAQDHPALRVVFALDRCTDATAEIVSRHVAEDARLAVVTVRDCPPEWAGKCHAAWRGAQEALGGAGDAPPEWILFTDADTRFDPRLVRAAVGCAERRGADLLSLLPRLTAKAPFERLVQPVASMLLLWMYPIERVNHPTRPRAFANGQFMLFRRGAYEAIGGHQAVRDDLLEDLAFARRLSGLGRRVDLVAAGELLVVSMYDSFAGFQAGWRRIFIEACRRKPGRLRSSATRMLLLGVAIPLLQAAVVACSVVALCSGAERPGWALPGLALVAIGLVLQAAALGWIYSLQGAPRLAILAYPLGAVVVARILLAGAADLVHRRPVRWGGREYVLEPR